MKKQIKIRTFSDWNDVVPGFFEGDLVAHCGDRVNGSFLNTLVLTDIASTWTEFFPLLRKSEADVIAALKVAQQLLPFLLLGLDADNGSEFINYALLEFCKMQKITFTRSRAYKKNDQAHVEEKNGSIIRRLVGYDRDEGLGAFNALSELYAVLRLYINFFQPSLKLISKKRDGAKVTKKYDKAKTPYQRLLHSPHVSDKAKEKLKEQYNNLDPLCLLRNLEKLQNNFWKHAWKSDNVNSLAAVNPRLYNIALPTNDISDAVAMMNGEINTNTDEVTNIIEMKLEKVAAKNSLETVVNKSNAALPESKNSLQSPARRYRRTNKPRKQLAPRTWRTRKDPFDDSWSGIRMQLELNPEHTAKSLLEDLIRENPDQFTFDLTRTMQRRVANWRREQVRINQERNLQNIHTLGDSVSDYVSLIAHAITSG